MNRRSLLAMIHIAKKNLALDDETYRALLERVTGSSSASRLDERDLSKVVVEFKRLGWKAVSKRSPKPYVRKVHALWAELVTLGVVKRGAALHAFVKRTVQVDNAEWLKADDARTVIESLKKWIARVQKEKRNASV